MPPLLLLLLAAGAVAAIAASKKDSKKDEAAGGGVFDSQTEKDMGRFALSGGPRGEAFMDPLFSVYGKGDYKILPYSPDNGEQAVGGPNRLPGIASLLNRTQGMDDGQTDVIVGYEYLSAVPNNAEARVAAMRDRVKSFYLPPPTITSDPGSPWYLLGGYFESSRNALRDYSKKVVKSYNAIEESAKEAASVASALGVDVRAVSKEVYSVLSIATGNNDVEVLDKALREYGPVAKSVATGIARVIELGTEGADSELDGAVKGLHVLSSILVAIPVYGWAAAAAIEFVASVLQGKIDGEQELCAIDLTRIRNYIADAQKDNIVVPWHGYGVFPPSCSSTGLAAKKYAWSDGVASLDSLYKKNLTFGRALPPAYSNSLERWWKTYQVFASHPEVSKIFFALGRDASGGVIASDEQVMLVAAPIAVSFGLDVDKLARALWKKGAGWASADKRAFQMGPVDSHILDGFGKTGCERMPWYCSFPHNAWWLQFATLSKACFAIAEDWASKKRLVKIDLIVPLGP